MDWGEQDFSPQFEQLFSLNTFLSPWILDHFPDVLHNAVIYVEGKAFIVCT